VTHGSWVTWVMGQELNGSLGSWVTLSDPFPALLRFVCTALGSAPFVQIRRRQRQWRTRDLILPFKFNSDYILPGSSLLATCRTCSSVL